MKFEPGLEVFLLREGQPQSITFTAMSGGISIVHEIQAEWLAEFFKRIDNSLNEWESKAGERRLVEKREDEKMKIRGRVKLLERMNILEIDEKFVNLCLMTRVAITALHERYSELFSEGRDYIGGSEERYEMYLLSDKIRLKYGKKVKKPMTPRKWFGARHCSLPPLQHDLPNYP